jgi:amino acid transporter
VEGIFAAVSSGGVIFALIGFRHAIDMAGEVKRPNVTIPLALGISLVICVAIYGLLQVAFVGAIDPGLLKNGWAGIEFAHDLGPVAGVAAALGIAWVSVVLKAGGVISPFGGGLVATGSMARLGYAMAQSRVFPRFFEKLSVRGVPMRCLWLDYVFGAVVVFFVPFGESVALNGAAITLSFSAGPLAVCALRHQLPDAERRFRMPMVKVLAPMAFVVSTLIIIWSGWHTTWRLGLTVLVGIFVFLVRMRQERVSFGQLDVREAAWLVPFLGGIGLISYLGDYGGGRGILLYPWGLVVAAVFSLGVFWIGNRLRLSNDAAAVYRERYATEEPPDMTPL